MGPTGGRAGQLVTTATHPAVGAPGAPLAPGSPRGWEGRLYDGLRVACVPPETREALAGALGALGVEAEFCLLLINGFGGPGLLPRARGETFLIRLEAASRRLVHSSVTLEVATQGFLAALESGYPEIRDESATADPWWPAFAGYAPPGEPVELRLRRCGYAYRHAFAANLGPSLEGVAEHMALALHALATLPPAGITPASSLYAGLLELSSALQGYAIPTHIASSAPERPGVLAGIARLVALDAREDSSLASDIAWARAQYQQARAALQITGADALAAADARRWSARASREWQDVLATLESLQVWERAGDMRP